MNRTLAAALVVVLAGLPACESSTDPGQRVTSVTVSPATRAMAPTETHQFQASARRADGTGVQNGAFQWQSTDPTVASVDQTGLVTALAEGTAGIVATLQGIADTADVQVFTAGAACEDPEAVVTLAVGESRTFHGAAASGICLDGTGAGAEFTLVPFFHSDAGNAQVGLSFQATGVGAVSGPPNPAVAPAPGFNVLGAAASSRLPPAHDDGGFHARLRERFEPVLTPLVPAARAEYQRRRAERPFRANVMAAVPTIGELMTFNVQTNSACESPDFRTGRVAAIGQRAIVVADTQNPANGLTDADYAHISTTMDTLVWPAVAGTFGEPADIDENGRVIIFYTRAVNELTPVDANFVVGGFFFGRDLFPRTNQPGFTGCAGSNYAEMFYMLAADEDGEVHGHKRPRDYVLRTTLGTVGHELQHLLSASRRLYVLSVGNSWNEQLFLNEGLSHIAEELMFYRASGMAPGANIDLDALRASERRLNAVNLYMISNIGRLGTYLEDPERFSPYLTLDELGMRGSSWAFLRYAADRRGGGQQQLWHDLLNNGRLGKDNLAHHLGLTQDQLREWVRDWNVAMYTDDAVPNVPARFRNPSWNFRNIYPEIWTPSAYPLRTRSLAAPADFTLRAGGAAYMRGAVSAGALAAVTATSGGGLLPQSVSITVVRTR